MSEYDILSPQLTVTALRDSGYKSTAYAIAELIDNSIDARAKQVDLVVVEGPVHTATQTRSRVTTIAVVDDGDGMDADTLRRALKFGDGAGRKTGRIGRFGMGLPNSSLSQCCRVDVWSWQNGVSNALHTYLDLAEISAGNGVVPEPDQQAVPREWVERTGVDTPSGTLVVWSQLDRVQWMGAEATFRHTEQLIGRVYRRKIVDGSVHLRLVSVRNDAVESIRTVMVNDPLYLITPSTAPAPFDTTAMFEAFDLGEVPRGETSIEVCGADGRKHKVVIRASIARPQARDADTDPELWPERARATPDAGNTAWGRHAASNVGVSILREGRELELDNGWTQPSEPRERWWGLEVEFPSDLDEVFGVTNNKQAATVLAQLAKWDHLEELQENESEAALRDRLRESGDPRGELLELVSYIQRTLKALRARVIAQRVGTRSGSKRKRHDDLNKRATDVIDRRRDDGQRGQTDFKEESATKEERVQEQVEALTNLHIPEEDARREVVADIEKKFRVRWVSASVDNSAFFSVSMLAGLLQVTFNMNHPVYEQLSAVLEPPSEEECDDPKELRQKLFEASDTFKLLLFAWARYEDEITSNSERSKVRQAREDWGRFARDFVALDE